MKHGYQSTRKRKFINTLVSGLFHLIVFSSNVSVEVSFGATTMKTTLARDGSVLFRNKMKPIYWSILGLMLFLTNRMASFCFETVRKRRV